MTGVINYYEGMFLGKEELARTQLMMRELMISSLLKGRDVEGFFSGVDKDYFSAPSSPFHLDLKAPGAEDSIIGIDGNRNFIVLPGSSNVNQNGFDLNAGDLFDLYIGAASHNWEKGNVTVINQGSVCYIQSDGNIDFTELFRNSMKGRYSRFKTEDGNIYTIQNVQDTNVAFLIETNVTAYTGKISVLPTLSPFYEGDGDELLYSYDFSQLYTESGSNRYKIGKVSCDSGGNVTMSWDIETGVI